MSKNTVPFDKEHVQAYLDRCIRFWREQDRDGNVVAWDYIDAFQSVRMSLFGESLSEEDSPDPRLLTTDAPAGSVGEQIDPQENVADDRPKANWKCPKCYLINAGDWPKCERCGEPSP